MDASEIKDEKSLKAWLESLPARIGEEEAQRWAVLIAHRAAMRVLPDYWDWQLIASTRNRDLTAIPVLLANLIGGVSGTRPERHFKERAAYAARAAEDVAESVRAPEDAGSAVDAAAKAARAFVDPDAAASAARATDGADAAAYAALESGTDLDTVPLWSTGNAFDAQWSRIRDALLDQGSDWQFWIDWYENALSGKPQDWDLLTKIALDTDIDWENPSDEVNALIAKIRLEHIAETRPLGDDAIEKGPDGIWHRSGRSDIDRDLLQDARDRVSDIIERIRARLPLNNALSALAPDLDLLDRALRRYPDRPLRLHDSFLTVQRHIARDLESGELPDEHIVRDLSNDLGTAALDMRNSCHKTAEVVAARVDARIVALDATQAQKLAQLARAAATLSNTDLAQEFEDDAGVVEGTAEPIEDLATLRYRLTTRLAKMVARDGNNIVQALLLIGGIGSGLTSMGALINLVLSFLL